MVRRPAPDALDGPAVFGVHWNDTLLAADGGANCLHLSTVSRCQLRVAFRHYIRVGKIPVPKFSTSTFKRAAFADTDVDLRNGCSELEPAPVKNQSDCRQHLRRRDKAGGRIEAGWRHRAVLR